MKIYRLALPLPLDDIPVDEDFKLIGSGDSDEYLKSIESGDMETAQRMVDAAAKEAGYNVGPVYHATDSDFTVFDKNRIGQNYTPHYGEGFYFATRPMFAQQHGKKMTGNFLNIQNPIKYTLQLEEDRKKANKTISEYVQGMGHDAIQVGDSEHVVFSSSQIKSADPVTRDDQGQPIPLSKRFDASIGDIRY